MGLEVAALTPRLLILLLCSLALFLGPAALAQGKDAAPEPEGGEGGEEDEDEFVIVDSPFEDLEVRCIEYGNPHACFEAGNRWFEGRGI